MAKKGSWNPIAFVPTQVTILSSLSYVALFAVLIWVHSTVPSAPSTPTPVKGVNLTEAWLDLDFVTDGFHPFNSRRNEVVRGYLVQRIEEMLERNGVGYKTVSAIGGDGKVAEGKEKEKPRSKAVTVFKDETSNVTFVDDFRRQPWTCYAESENVMVYIRGEEDEAGDWWEEGKKYDGQSGVLVNAHYDSVSSGFGATDDGVGVVTILQLISYFTTDGNRPKRGIVALFNDGEEDGLYGAHDYLRHPLAQFTHTFLNLEGAGAGGKAMLFRSTDAEVTRFYSQSRYPFGSVVSGDGFKRGFIHSGTDYSVFNGDQGMRGLDVAFFEPRARYHTDQDDVRDTSEDSVWHMLSASLATMKAMTSYSGNEFEGSSDETGKLNIGTGNDGVWFDMFGRAFAVLRLSTLFALSVTLLAATPVILIVLQIILTKRDKWYPLSKRQYLHSSDDDESVHFSGLRGLFRFPIAFVIGTAAVLALAYLQTKINPFIIYSGEYAVWAMMFSAWFAGAWFFFAGADRVRPTALQRMYNLIWLYAVTWTLLVAVTVGENNFKIASGYMIVIYNATAFLALLISYLELFALPTKTAYVERVANADEEIDRRSERRGSQSSRTLLRQSESRTRDGEDDEATERTSLLRGGDHRSGTTFTGVAKGRRHPDNDGTLDEIDKDPILTKAYGDEQAWSSSLPQWTWILQFLILAPINIIIIGQVALLLTHALNQTPADGNAVLPIYLFFAALTVLLLLPLTPFLHRFTYHVPTFVFVIFIGCLIYNLLAFPFSRDARLKVYFVQQIDLDSGINNVTLTGLDGFVQNIIGELPSTAGQPLDCDEKVPDAFRNGLRTCVWHGLAPNVVDSETAVIPYSNYSRGNDYKSWLSYNVTHLNNSAHFSIQGPNTKQCRLVFDHPISGLHIENAASDPRYHSVAEKGSSQVRLISRSWDKNFRVTVTWPSGQEAKNQTGKAVCMWSDANQLGTVPAFDEIRRFEPVWSAVTKQSDGLVEGFKEFRV